MKNFKIYLSLHLLMGLFSLAPVFSKLAGQNPFFSKGFIVFYGLSLFVLVIYAFGWQQVIKHLPLTTAYANKAVTVVWGMLWGFFIFNEGVTPLKVLGAAVIIAGIILYATPSAAEKSQIAAAEKPENIISGEDA